MKLILSILLLAATNVTVTPIITPLDTKFAAQAAASQRQDATFDTIFQKLCQMTLSEAGKNPKLRLDDCTRSMFGGLWLWARGGGNPSLQGRNDWAQHFIGGGAFEGYWDTGQRAGVRKEQIDSRDPNNFYDLDDLAATFCGSRWMDVATHGDTAGQQRWLELWATGKLTLARSLPKLTFGHLPPGKQATAEQIRAIRDAVDSALKLP